MKCRWLGLALTVALAAAVSLGPATAAAQAAFPGHNGRIAYVEADRGSCAGEHGCSSFVSTVRPDGTGRRRFFDANSRFDNCVPLCQTFAPAYSPAGGRLLAQVCCNPPPILIVPAGNPRRPRALRRGTRIVKGHGANWLPDGHAVVFTGFDGVVRRLRANRIRRLGDGADPQWSRKNRVAVVRDEGTGALGLQAYGIFTMDPRGRKVRRVASGTGPDWSPRGDWLVYATPEGSIHMARGTTVRRLFLGRPGIAACDPAFSPDGRWIVFSGGNGFCSGTDEKGPLFVMRLDGSGLRSITPDSAGGASWQPLPRR